MNQIRLNVWFHSCAIIILALFLSNCSTTRVLSPDEALFKSAEVSVEDKGFLKSNSLEKDLKEYISPEPNRKFAGFMPVKLWMYNLAGDTAKDSGIRRFLRNKLGEKPVIFNPEQINQNTNRLQNRLYNLGYFNSTLSSKIDSVGEQKVKVVYNIKAKTAYTIDTITYPKPTNRLTSAIDSMRTFSLLETGDEYNIEVIKEELQRISNSLKELGYFYFIPDHLIFKADSNNAEKNIDLYLQLEKNMPDRASRQYYLNEIRVDIDDNYNLPMDSTVISGMQLSYNPKSINPDVIANAIFLEKGKLYNENDYKGTLDNFVQMGIFTFTNIDFKNAGKSDSLLNVIIDLQVAVPKSVRLELQATTNSNNLTGPSLHATYTDRNLLGGAEKFALDLSGGFQFEITQDAENISIYEYGATMDYDVPRFIRPFRAANKWLGNRYTPNTNIQLGYDFVNRVNTFELNGLNASYGFTWQETATKSHELELLSLSYSKLSDISNDFDSLLQNDYFVQQSYVEKFIFGLSYSYIFNNRNIEDRFIKTFFHANIELAGNSFSLLQKIINNENPSPEDPLEFLGIDYSQFALLRSDLRFTLPFNNQSNLIYRIRGDFGIPYGNSAVLPYNRQFYVGGASSVRGFQSRTIGPGALSPEDDSTRASYILHTGDIRLETNLEYRFNIISFLKGAFFVDVGNVYDYESASDTESTIFRWNTFADFLAVSGGTGLRIDASFFVLRFDLGVPFRKPYLEGDKWVLDEVDFSDPAWRRKNMVLSIAIGYPF